MRYFADHDPEEPAGWLHRSHPDPLDPDSEDDARFPITLRSLLRVALVAAETGARFQREACGADVMTWLLTPRPVFDGRVAIDAVLDLEGCLRAILLHGLGLDPDMDRASLDRLPRGVGGGGEHHAGVKAASL